MPLTLVLGPANSAKAGEVLGAYAAAAHRGALLVVPTALDAEHYARELAAEGTLLGSVLTFSGLAGEIARRAAFHAARATELQRERLLARAITAAELDRFADAAESPGFLQAAGELISELQRSLVTPARFADALRTWAAADSGRDGFGGELASLYFSYRRELERAGKLDGDLFAWRALDALRQAPGRWGSSAVFFYGFDDLHRLQRDAIETLSSVAGVEVTVSLTHEGGRTALAARAETVEELRPLAQRVIEMPALDEHYAPPSRQALHHLERGLFEQPIAGRVAAGDAVRLLEAGGERAEAELLAAEVLTLIRDGVAPGEIAVVLRSPKRAIGAVTRVFSAYGIPVASPRSVPLEHMPLGRGLLALARCALLDERSMPAGVLIDYLRTPGVAVSVDVLDGLEAGLLRAAIGSVAAARARPGLELGELESLRHASDVPAELGEQARRLLAGRWPGHAPVLDGASEQDARACAAVLVALDELAELEPGIRGAELIEALERVRVPIGAQSDPGAVLISDPLSIRARRFRAVLVGGLQESEFPLAGAPEPFLSDEVRWELAACSGLRLSPREDALSRERYLFYACVSRATERLVLSYRSSDEEGNLALPSPFLRDVAELLDEGWWERRRRRLLADVVWEPEEAPTERERLRALAAVAAALPGPATLPGPAAPPAPPAPPASPLDGRRYRLSPVALSRARHREIVSAGALETFADCPVKWLVESQLQPQPLAATPEPMARGSFMHETLERVLGELGQAVTPASLPRALELLGEALGELPAAIALEAPAGVRAAALRMIEADLRRYLEQEAADGCDWDPARLEQRFGFDEESSLPALALGEGEERVLVRGAIDRIDIDPGAPRAIIRDYKSGALRPEFQAARWSGDRRLQVPLYMLAVRELLRLEPVAGFYQQLRGGELRPRGVFRKGVPVGERASSADGCDPDELDALLEDARARALALAARLRAGDLEPCPRTCSREGCRYPGICRSA